MSQYEKCMCSEEKCHNMKNCILLKNNATIQKMHLLRKECHNMKMHLVK